MEDEHSKRNFLGKLFDLVSREPKNRDDLVEILREAEQRHLLSSEMLGMIESVLQVSEMHVRDVMVPQAQMVVINKNSQLDDILPIINESHHSRFPVIDEKNEEVLGILLAKDLLLYCVDKTNKSFSVVEIMRETIFVPESKRLDVLLHEFRLKHNHMALVLDEYGGISGLVTIEDVLEQIVGDIEDEFDIDEDDYIKKFGEQCYVVKAHTPVDDFNEQVGAVFSTEESDTIGGLVLKGFGYLPKRGEMLSLGGYRFKVLHGDNRRLRLLEVTIDG